jgi:PST family polysaccharide transporter
VERRAAREILYFGMGFSVARMGNWAAVNGDKWVVGRWLGQEALGFYKYAFELTGMIANLFAQVLDRVLFPTMAKVQSNPVRLATAYRRGVALIALVVLPASAMVIVLAPEFILGVLGEGWESVVGPFRVLAAVLLIRATYKMSDSMARATGAVYRRAWRQSIYAAAVIGFAWVGHHWGLTALSIGVGLGIFVNFLLMAQLSLSLAHLHWRDVVVAHLGAAPSFAIAFGSVYGLATIVRPFSFHPIVAAALITLASGLVLGVILRLAPRLLLGPDGIGAIRMLLDFAETQAPGVTRSRLVTWLLPRVVESR